MNFAEASLSAIQRSGGGQARKLQGSNQVSRRTSLMSTGGPRTPQNGQKTPSSRQNKSAVKRTGTLRSQKGDAQEAGHTVKHASAGDKEWQKKLQKLHTPKNYDLFVSAEEIAANICTSKDCRVAGTTGCPHRHQVNACKLHPFCVADPQQERVQVHSSVPMPLPTNSNHHQEFGSSFLAGVQRGRFGESGPQRPGTKTVATKYSLDHYWAQQWALDVDAIPGTMPPELADVHKLFYGYVKRGLPKQTVKPSQKPTLRKKLNQWQKAQIETRELQLELMYWRSNQDPKVYALLQEFMNERPEAENAHGHKKHGSVKMGRSTNKAMFRLADDREMVPMVFPETMHPEPLVNQLSKEHDDIAKRAAQNPTQKLGHVAEDYYREKQHAREKEEARRRVKNVDRPVRQTENYLPSKAAKRRMDSEHLNTWMKRNEIQEIAERYAQFQEMLLAVQKEPDQSHQPGRQNSHGRALSISQKSRSAVAAGKNRLKTAAQARQQQRSVEMRGRLQESLNSGAISSRGGKPDLLTNSNPRIDTQLCDSGARIGLSSTKSQYQMVASTQGNRPASTGASSQVKKQRFGHSPSQKSQAFTAKHARLFSAKPSGITSYAVDSTAALLDKNAVASTCHSIEADYCKQPADSAPWGVPASGKGTGLSAIEVGSMQLGSAAKEGQKIANSHAAHFSSQRSVGSRKQPILSGSSSRNSSHLGTPAGRQLRQKRLNSQSYAVSLHSGAKQAQSAIYALDKSPKEQSDGPDGPGSAFTMLVEENGDYADLNRVEKVNQAMNGRHQSAPRIKLSEQSEAFEELFDKEATIKGHLTNVFQQARWQNEKSRLLQSMNFHLTKYRPQVRLTQEQEQKKAELSSYKRLGNSFLQTRLSHQYGINDIPKVELPETCQVFLSEVPQLVQEKLKEDERLRSKRLRAANSCAHLSSTQPIFDTMNKTVTVLDQTDGSTAKELAINVQELGQAPNQSTLGMRAQELSQANKSKLVSAPRDPKPNVQAIMIKRNGLFKEAFLSKVTDHAKETKQNWRKDADELNSDRSERKESAKNIKSSQQAPTEAPRTSSHGMTAAARHNQRSVASAYSVTTSAHKDKHQSLSKSLEQPSHQAGQGAPVRGQALRKVTAKILAGLDEEIEEQPTALTVDVELKMPALAWDPLELNKHIADMSSVAFWQQKGLQCSKQGKIDAAMDYYRQGLRQHPTEQVLIYSLAVCYCQLKKFRNALSWFGFGVNLVPRWMDGLCGVAICHFNLGDFEHALKFINLAKENCKGEVFRSAKLSYDQVSFIHATCLKMTNNLDLASKVYVGLEPKFAQQRGRELIKLVWGLILIPLSLDRKMQDNHLLYLRQYMEHIQAAKLPVMDHQNLLLSKYCYEAQKNVNYKTGKLYFQDFQKEPRRLDFETYPKSIMALLNRRSFFKRFSRLRSPQSSTFYAEALRRAEVELYGKDQPVFLRGRVGVVLMGSVEVRKHESGEPMKPFVVKKAIEGDILGFSEGDANTSASPLSWLVSMQDQTEVIFLQEPDFNEVWGLQKKFTEQQIVIQKLDQNKYFGRLNLITKYHLVFESLHMRIFFPGQLIMSVHQRSPLCLEYHAMYKEGTSKFRRDIDQKIARDRGNATAADTSLYTGLMSKLNQGETSQELIQLQEKIKQKRSSIDQDSVQHLADPGSARQLSVSFRAESSIRGISRRSSRGRGQDNEDQDMQKEEGLSCDSNSTDYGLSHGQNLLNGKREYKTIEQFGSDGEAANDEKGLYEIDEVDFSRGSSSERGRVHDSSDEGNELVVRAADQDRRKNQGSRLKTTSPPSRFNTKRVKLQKVLTEEVISVRPNKRKIPFSRKSSVVSNNAPKTDQSKDSASTKGKTDQNLSGGVSAGESQSQLACKKVTVVQYKQYVAQKQNYKFLLAKQVEKLRRDDSETKRRHKRQKRQMKSLLAELEGVLADMKTQAANISVDMAGVMKRLLTQKLDQVSQANKTPQMKVGLPVDQSVEEMETQKDVPVQMESSGISNTLMIDRVAQAVQQVADTCVGETANEQILYKLVLEAIERAETQNRGRREEPTGVHFIDSGEVFAVNSQGLPNLRLNKLDTFGLCDYLKKLGPEFLGDVRAGNQPVQTFFFTYEDFKRRISIPEKIRLQTMDEQRQRIEGNINFICSREKIPLEKFQHF